MMFLSLFSSPNVRTKKFIPAETAEDDKSLSRVGALKMRDAANWHETWGSTIADPRSLMGGRKREISIASGLMPVRGAKLLAGRRRILRMPTIKLVTGTRILAWPPVRRGGVS